ncbi:30S ribosomal protein S17 [Parasphingopyxis sp. GrpM-11]|uniref:Small ribosomal subunit protein uS17 n=1 Tax=Parasphingopyxis marina TaxID=2761622 RepID=A0A842HVA0_9SPHN|nr:30S ribosomal protein S17 [Parasphingopyxis marina]MBC2776892.1 30S ribosomal protein S17 [Parasphingopyxis marina]
MPKRVLTGMVVSDKTNKTVVVKVERKVKHPLYGKIIRLSKKYHAHDESNEFKAGETVRIEETRPISKLKTWKVLDRVDTHKAPKHVEKIDIAESKEVDLEAAKDPEAEQKAEA